MQQRRWFFTFSRNISKVAPSKRSSPGMDFEADIHAGIVIGIEYRLPSFRQFAERGIDEALRPLRPGIGEWPCKRAGKCHMRARAQDFATLWRPA